MIWLKSNVQGHSFTKRAVCRVGERSRTVRTMESGEAESELELDDSGSYSKVKDRREVRDRRSLGRYGSWMADEESWRMRVRSRMWRARERLEERIPSRRRVWMNLGALRCVMRKVRERKRRRWEGTRKAWETAEVRLRVEVSTWSMMASTSSWGREETMVWGIRGQDRAMIKWNGNLRWCLVSRHSDHTSTESEGPEIHGRQG